MPDAAPVLIDVWSDYVCPFCCLELPVLDRLRRADGALELRWHAFEQRPEPMPLLDPAGQAVKTSWARSVLPMARQRGLNLHQPAVQPRSRKAFEAAEHARRSGTFEPLHRALFAAFFERGLDIGDVNVLVAIGQGAGLDAGALRAALARGTHAEPVLQDQRLAQRLSIRSVPAMVLRSAEAPLHDGVLVSGAQPFETLAAALQLVRGTAVH
jgi:predicted DsbA family dithiol-disulfide isomerase